MAWGPHLASAKASAKLAEAPFGAKAAPRLAALTPSPQHSLHARGFGLPVRDLPYASRRIALMTPDTRSNSAASCARRFRPEGVMR